MANLNDADTHRGLYNKFTVTRNDGSSEPGQRHSGCQYFVLDVDHDPHAFAALKAYADSCKATYPLLSVDVEHLAEKNRRKHTPLPPGASL